MRVTSVTVIVAMAAVAGFFAGRWATLPESLRQAGQPAAVATVSNDYAVPPPMISKSQAQDYRETHYEGIETIGGVLDLPTDFAQTEALYTIAGRANQAELERLIGESMGIVNRYDRSAALHILFTRYAELNPAEAVRFLVDLELDIDDQIFSSLFEAWARADLNAAVTGANSLDNRRQRKRASHAVLTIAARIDEALIEQVAADLTDHHELGHIRSEAVGIRANGDPQRALQEALTMDSHSGRWDAMRRVATVWARNDPAGALQNIDQITDHNMRRQFTTTVLKRWIEDDPVQAIQYVSTHPNAVVRQEMLQQSLGVYAQINPEEAFHMASELTGSAKQQAAQHVISQWVADDLDGAMLAINAIDDRSERMSMLTAAGQALAQHSTDKALAWLDGLDTDVRKVQMETLLQQIAYRDSRRALEYAMTRTTGSERPGTLNSVLQYAIANDPVTAEDYIYQLPDGPERDRLYQRLGNHYARSGSESTLQWIAGLSGGARNSALRGAAMSLAGSDPRTSASLIAELPAKDAAEVLRTVSNRLSHSDPQAALDWLGQFRGREGYQPALGDVIQSVARSDPRRALSLASKLDDNLRNGAVSTALSNWASTDPHAAANWARNSDSVVRTQAVQAVASRWATNDPAAAERWVYALPESDGKDRALTGLAMATRDARKMADLVSSISSESTRRQAIASFYQVLLRRHADPRSANEFFDSVGAPPELREQLFTPDGR